LSVQASDGLVEIAPSRIGATSRGRLLLRIMTMCFDRYLNAPSRAAAQLRYSRAI
jgi:oxygen-independent coproporphyrinogen-3 oxidase